MPLRIIFMSFFISLSSYAGELHLAVLGGGGEPKVETTIFDGALKEVGTFYKNNPSTKLTVAFNGGHAVTEKISQDNFGATRPFTADNYNAAITDYVNKISSGVIKPGDKILVYVNTHGATKSPNEQTHGIATIGQVVTNFDSFSGPSVVSMDNLKRLTEIAEKKGVKLGIVDLSCHSGNSLALANSATCVISSTGPNHYAGAGTLAFGTLISKGLTKGKNLEEVFLEARSRFTDMSFPMISTPQGLEVQSRIYDPITPYLYYYHETSNKFGPYMESLSSGEKCELDDGFGSLMAESNAILKSSVDPVIKKSILEFQAAVKNYYDFMTDLRKNMQGMGLGELNNKHQFCSDETCVDYTVKQLMTIDYDALTSFFTGQAQSSKGNDKKTNLAYAENARKAQLKRDELLQANPKLKDAHKFWSSLPNLTTRTSTLQAKVASSQHRLYQELYRRHQTKESNPCRDFVL